MRLFSLPVYVLFAMTLCSCGVLVTDIEGEIDHILEGSQPRAAVTVINGEDSQANYTWAAHDDAGGGYIAAYDSATIRIQCQDAGETVDILFFWFDGGLTVAEVFVEPGKQMTIYVSPDPLVVATN